MAQIRGKSGKNWENPNCPKLSLYSDGVWFSVRVYSGGSNLPLGAN